jgi:hypothetical protein
MTGRSNTGSSNTKKRHIFVPLLDPGRLAPTDVAYELTNFELTNLTGHI